MSQATPTVSRYQPRPGCDFCDYAAETTGDTMVIEPFEPVVRGHVMIVPREHVPRATDDPQIAARVMFVAAHMAREIGDCNLIFNNGPLAGQSVSHMHLHVVPRAAQDHLCMPWRCQSHLKG